MAVQTVFKRYELKYLLTAPMKQQILKAMEPYMEIDEYGRKTVRNIYYDTSTYQLIRHSIEAPIYKEKLRIRSYEQADENSMVFVELKKKYDSVVYKRRMALNQNTALDWIDRRSPRPLDSQIAREIDYFLHFYPTLEPKAFLSYEREAYFTKIPSDLRITFDDTILFREDQLSLQAPIGGDPLLPNDLHLMEIKCSGAFPLWLVSALSENHIRRCSYSKYGTAYKTIILPKIQIHNS